MSRRQWKQASASQITTHRRCASRWYANKILGLAVPETEAMRRGKAYHAELEAYELSGNVSALSERTRPVTAFLHVPDGGLDASQVERRVWLHTEVVPILGYLDLELPELRTVVDHKTTSDFRYCRDEYTLAHDTQAIIYCFDALERWGGDEPITFRHIYYRTRGVAKSQTVEVQLEPETIRERFAALVDELDTMAQHAEIEDFGDVPVNLDACNDYGGCPFRAHCRKAGKLPGLYDNLTREDTMPSQLMMRIAERKAAQEAAKATPEPEPQATPEPEPEPVLEVGAVNPPDGTPADEAVELETKRAAPLRLPSGVLLSSARKRDLEEAWREIRRKALGLGRDVTLSWDGESKTTVAELQRDVAKLLELETPTAKIDQAIAEAKAPQAEEPLEVETPQAEEPLEELKSDWSRLVEEIDDWDDLEWDGSSRRVSATVLRRDIQRMQSRTEPQEPEPDAPQEPTEPKGDKNDETGTLDKPDETRPLVALFLGCHPQGLPVVYLDEILAPIQEGVARERKVDHYTLIKFNEGPKLVAAVLARGLRDGELTLPRVLVIPYRAPCADAVTDVLLPYYRRAGGLIVGRMG